MTSHDPDTLRRIMLLLKGKKKAGRALSKESARSNRVTAYRDNVITDNWTPKSNQPKVAFKDSGNPWNQEVNPELLRERLTSDRMFPPRANDYELVKEVEKMVQLLDSGQEGKKHLRRLLLKASPKSPVTRRQSEIQKRIDRLPINDVPF